jgi:phage terminase large subunit-like protein
MGLTLESLMRVEPKARMRIIRGLSAAERLQFLHSWKIWGRPKQQWEPDTRYTFVTSGRGWGKTRMGAEIAHQMAYENIEDCGGVLGIAGRTHTDVIKDLVESSGGILATQKPWNRCRVHKDAVSWESGAVGYIMSGDTPSKFRGKNTGWLWCDEFAHWQYPQKCQEAFDFDVRNGKRPSIFITSTPLPIPIVSQIWNDPATKRINGHTNENVLNLPPDVVRGWIAKYEGSDLGDQELRGLILDTNKHAPFSIENIRRIEVEEMPIVTRTILAIDPAGGSKKKNDETGMVVCAADDYGETYVIADYSEKMGADEWGRRAIHYARFHGCDAIVGETNFGGDMVMTVIRQRPEWEALRQEMGIDLREVTAGKSKGDRAIPINAMYQQGRVFHVGSPRNFDRLEYQMTHFDTTLGRDKQASPDRMDALVHCIAALHPDREGLSAPSAQNENAVKDWQNMLGSLLR